MRVYVDTPIIVDSIRGVNPQQVQLFEHLLEASERGVCKLLTSEMVIAETLDTLQRYKYYEQEIQKGRRDIETIYHTRNARILSPRRRSRVRGLVNRWFAQRQNSLAVQHPATGEAFWALLLALCSYTDIFTPDCIHLTQAILLGCDILCSEDTHFCTCINEQLQGGTQARRSLERTLLEHTGSVYFSIEALNAQPLHKRVYP